jgi:hypothetical protein
MQRRELLQKVITAAIAAGIPGLWSSAWAHPHPCEVEAAENLELFKWKMQQRAARDSSEQSTPMFLALENLDAPAGQAAYIPDSFNQELFVSFERYVDLLLQYKPEPDESDVAVLIEMLAARELVPVNAELCS